MGRNQPNYTIFKNQGCTEKAQVRLCTRNDKKIYVVFPSYGSTEDNFCKYYLGCFGCDEENHCYDFVETRSQFLGFLKEEMI